MPFLNLNGKVIVWLYTILVYTAYLWLSVSDGVTGLKELAFLRDLAEQNSGKYGVLDRTALPVIKGSMMVLNQLSNLETTVGRFYTNLPNRMIDEAVFSLPFSDEMGDGESGDNFLLKEGEKKQTWVHQNNHFEMSPNTHLWALEGLDRQGSGPPFLWSEGGVGLFHQSGSTVF